MTCIRKVLDIASFSMYSTYRQKKFYVCQHTQTHDEIPMFEYTLTSRLKQSDNLVGNREGSQHTKAISKRMLYICD